jgi:phosphate transport system permease protein
VYLSEYASRATRAFAKPLLEVLAGIPTIVYGLFALTVVGPLLVNFFGADGLGWMQGARSVMTAGLVMGIMLIPFVSSLSDDIINAVPQAMRDGSYGLGATQSETVRQVVLPAALPGIVGAILLAASRAIGETMIVVMGAGAAARLDLNPFEAMTTVTAKIVSQLTGDSDFASPEALVAFALGMTLFLLTLGLNVLALYIVRKYREQYECATQAFKTAPKWAPRAPKARSFSWTSAPRIATPPRPAFAAMASPQSLWGWSSLWS